MFYLILISFTLLATLLLCLFVPMALLDLTSLCLKRRKDPMPRFSKIILVSAGGFGIGMATAWVLVIVPSGWRLPVWETMYAGFRSDIYGHVVEHAAEQYSLFMLFIGDLGALVVGTAAFLRGRHRLRPIKIA